MIKDYVIIRGFTVSELEDKVKVAVKEGWEPTGGVCWGSGNFYQAMIKTK